jgi:hypothetical protein
LLGSQPPAVLASLLAAAAAQPDGLVRWPVLSAAGASCCDKSAVPLDLSCQRASA